MSTKKNKSMVPLVDDTMEPSELEMTALSATEYQASAQEAKSESGLGGIVGKIFRLNWAAAAPSEHNRGREFRRAVREEDLGRVQKMIRDGVGVNESQEASLACVAVRRKNLDLLEILIDAGVDVNHADRRNRSSRLRTPLQEAARKGWIEGVDLLLASKADVDAVDDVGATALHLAVRAGKASVVKRLLRAGASVHGSAQARLKPLHEAVTPEMAKLLLDHGADVNSVDAAGASVLYHQAKSGRLSMVDFLLENGADKHHRDLRGRHVLFAPGQKGDARGVFERLFQEQIDINIRDHDNNNIAHLAATRCLHPQVLMMVYEKTPHLWLAKNNDGQSAYDIITGRGFHDLSKRIIRDRDLAEHKSKQVEQKRYNLFDPQQ